MTDRAARLAAFRAGQFDFLGSSPVSNESEARSLLDSNPDTVVWTTPVLFGVFSIGVNHDNPKWADERIRQGLSISINRDEIATALWGATGVPMVLGLPWIFLFDSPPTGDDLGPWFDFKPEEGQKLLAAAGAEDFEFDVVYFNYNVSNLPQDELIQDQLRQVGVTMNLNALDITTYNSQLQTASYDDAIDGFATGGATATTFYRDHLRPGAGLNRWNINDAMLTQWGEDQSTELDPDVRKEILRKIWDRETQFLFKGLPKSSGMGFNVKNPRLRNYRVGGPLVNVTALGDEGTYMSDAWLDV